MQHCKCAVTRHDNHPGKACDKLANTDDVYCSECHSTIAGEHADTDPDTRIYKPR